MLQQQRALSFYRELRVTQPSGEGTGGKEGKKAFTKKKGGELYLPDSWPHQWR